MEKTDQIKFIRWLTNRLIYVYGHKKNDRIVILCDSLARSITEPYRVTMRVQDLDKIISKYYVDFLMDKSEELNMGFSEKERNNLRFTIENIVNDIVNKNIPEEHLIKDMK